jgi:cell division protein FtsB
MENLGVIITILVGLVTLAVAFAFGWPLLRGKSLAATNEVLDKALTQERREREESEVRCKREISRLEGRIDALTGSFAKQLAERIVTETGKRTNGG